MGADFHSTTWYVRSAPSISVAEFNDRRRDHQTLFSDKLTVDEFTLLVEKYQINYVILDTHMPQLEKIMKRSKLVDDTVLQFGTLRLWKIIAPE
jgi:hypothetical protein